MRQVAKDNTGSQYAQGMALLRQGQHEAALAQLSPLASRKDLIGQMARYHAAAAHRSLGLCALTAGDYPAAEGHLRAAIRLAGRQADLVSYLASLYVRTARADDCLDEIDRLAQLDDSAASQRKLAQAQWHAGRRVEACLTLESAIRHYPNDAGLHLQLGLFLSSESKLDKAGEHLARSAQLEPSSPTAHHYLGLVHAAKRQPQQAARCFQRALDLAPHDLMIAYQLALAARAASQSAQPIRVRPGTCAPAAFSGSQVAQLAQYVAAESDFLDAMLSLQGHEQADELLEALLAVVQVALADHENYADLHHHASVILARLGRAEQAIEHARKAIAINSRYVKALVHLAQLEAASGATLQAVMRLERAVAAGGDWADVHCQLGELLAQHDPKRARKHFERALELNRNYRQAANKLAGLAA